MSRPDHSSRGFLPSAMCLSECDLRNSKMRTTSTTSAVEPRIKMMCWRKQNQSRPVARYRSTFNVVRTVRSLNIRKYPIIRPIFEVETSKIAVKPLACKCQTTRLLEFQADSSLSRQCVRIKSVAGHSFTLMPVCFVLHWQIQFHIIHMLYTSRSNVVRISITQNGVVTLLLTLRLLMSHTYIYIWSTYSWCF